MLGCPAWDVARLRDAGPDTEGHRLQLIAHHLAQRIREISAAWFKRLQEPQKFRPVFVQDQVEGFVGIWQPGVPHKMLEYASRQAWKICVPDHQAGEDERARFNAMLRHLERTQFGPEIDIAEDGDPAFLVLQRQAERNPLRARKSEGLENSERVRDAVVDEHFVLKLPGNPD